MKKVLSLMLIAMLAVTLSACNGKTDIPQEILDCVQNPSDPGCEIPEVDCVLHPDDVSCEPEPVDCTVTPTDPSCEEPVDCTVTPTDPSCEEPVECETGYVEVAGECVLVVVKTPEQVLADLVVENWQGGMSHVRSAMAMINSETATEMTIEANLEVLEDGVTTELNVFIKDSYVYGEDMIIKREITVDADGEHLEFQMIFEEVGNGLNIYYDTAFLRSVILTPENDPDGEIEAILDTLGADDQWFMFSFDDSLANMIEMEVLKDMLVAAFVQEFGADFFVEVQTELELELGVDLDTYNIDLDAIMDLIVAEDYDSAVTLLEGIDFDTLIYDLDAIHLVPELVTQLTNDLTALEALDATIDVNAWILELSTNGTEAWLNTLTEIQVEVLIAYYIDEDLATIISEYNAGTLDHFVMMTLFNDVDFYTALSEIPGLDEAALMTAFDVLDYDALYLEMADLSSVPVEVYNGQASFDTFVTALAVSSPQTASLLVPFSGTVLFLEDYKVYVDDIIYGFENLNMFEQYLSMDYYVENEMVVYTVEATTDAEVVTTITLDPSQSTFLFIDLMADIWTFGNGFESFEMPYVQFINCPAGEECMPFAEYAEILSGLNQLGNSQMAFTYNPSDLSTMEMSMDMTSFMNSMMLMNDQEATVVNMSITMTESNISDFDAPATATDLNAAALEFAKFSLMLEAYNYLEGVTDYYTENPSELPALSTDIPLSDFTDLGLSYAFDADASFVTIGMELVGLVPTYNYEITLVWLDGTNVFTEAIGWEELVAVVGNNTGVPSRADYLTFIALVDETNFNMTKLALVYLWQEDNMDYNQDNDYMMMTELELAMYDGSNGMPMYVAYNGYVYDVTYESAWSTGSHQGMMAGTDITAALDASGHGPSVLDGITIVGEIYYPAE